MPQSRLIGLSSNLYVVCTVAKITTVDVAPFSKIETCSVIVENGRTRSHCGCRKCCASWIAKVEIGLRGDVCVFENVGQSASVSFENIGILFSCFWLWCQFESNGRIACRSLAVVFVNKLTFIFEINALVSKMTFFKFSCNRPPRYLIVCGYSRTHGVLVKCTN